MTEKIIMDVDPGVDDAAALTMAINNPEIDLKLITTVAGNVTLDKTTINALKINHFFNAGIPVAMGAKLPLIKEFEDAARIHGESGMPGYDFGEDYGKPIELSAVEAMRKTILENDQITIVATGSYTNVALLFSQYPEVKSHIKRIIAMGGSLSGGNMTSAAEFNVFTDPDAAWIMYHGGVPITMIGLDITLKATLLPEHIEKLATINESGKMLASLNNNYHDVSAANGKPQHDVNTIFYLLHPEAFAMKEMWIDIQTSGPAIGATVGDIRAAYHDGQTNANVGLDIDVEAFRNWYLSEVSKIKRD